MGHGRSTSNRPQTQGKIERWHQTLKKRISLENYFLLGDLERQIEAFVAYYNHQRYDESLGNLTPSDVYFGRNKAIIEKRRRIKEDTMKKRCLDEIALLSPHNINQREPDPQSKNQYHRPNYPDNGQPQTSSRWPRRKSNRLDYGQLEGPSHAKITHRSCIRLV